MSFGPLLKMDSLDLAVLGGKMAVSDFSCDGGIYFEGHNIKEAMIHIVIWNLSLSVSEGELKPFGKT